MRRRSILGIVKDWNKAVFTTRELSLASGKSPSAITQSLNNLAKERVVVKIYRGVWADERAPVSPYMAIPYLFGGQRVYVSFISALHLHGIIEQIPQVTTIASTGHARIIRTKLGVYYVHHIAPSFFTGFDWYRGDGSFLIAEPEKALVDSLYISAYKNRQFGHFPELHFTSSFGFRKVKGWVKKIPSRTTRIYVQKKLGQILKAL